MSENTHKPMSVTAAKSALRAELSEVTALANEGSRLMVRIGVHLANASDVVSEQPKALKADETFIEAVKAVYDVPQPRIESLVRTGRVARVIGLENIDGSVSESALEQLHKLLSDKATPDADTRTANVLAVWAKASRDGRTTIARVKATVAGMFPTLEGSRGPKSGSVAAAGNGKGKAKPKAPAKARNDVATQPLEKPDLAVTGARLGGANTAVTGLFGMFESDAAKAAAHKVAVAILASVEKYGLTATALAVEKHTPKATPKATAKATTTTTAKPKATARKRTAKATAAK